MRSNTKLLRLMNDFQIGILKKGQTFKDHFVASTFCLFLGFMCGNLFGTFLNYFRSLIHWDGAIIALILLFIEFINYLHFTVSKKWFTKNASRSGSFKQKLKPFWKNQGFKNQVKTKTSQISSSLFIDFLFNMKEKFILFIRLLNFYKLGLLLGFFIDAFKVGS